jgi:hypothetical protein
MGVSNCLLEPCAGTPDVTSGVGRDRHHSGAAASRQAISAVKPTANQSRPKETDKLSIACPSPLLTHETPLELARELVVVLAAVAPQLCRDDLLGPAPLAGFDRINQSLQERGPFKRRGDEGRSEHGH